MKKIRNVASVGVLLAGTAMTLVNSSALTVGGIHFEDDAFADKVSSFSGAYYDSGEIGASIISAARLAEVLTDKDPATFAYSYDENAFVMLGFTDNVLVNGSGDDLAIFEVDIADSFLVSLTVGGDTRTYASTYTGQNSSGFKINVATVNLDDFGIAPGAALDSVVIGLSLVTPGGDPGTPSLSLVGAINSASVPDGASTLTLAGISALALVPLSRRVAKAL